MLLKNIGLYWRLEVFYLICFCLSSGERELQTSNNSYSLLNVFCFINIFHVAEGSAGKSPNFLCLGETDKRVMLADRRRASGDSGDTASASSVQLVRPVSCQV